MRLPKKKVKIAIYGNSGTGKTSVVSELAKLINGEALIRHCGELLKERSKALGLGSPSCLPIEEHKALDEETRQLVRNTLGDIIAEGRYLNFVLNGDKQIIFVHLLCNREQRITRLERAGKQVDSEDNNDNQLIRRLYGEVSPTFEKLITLDTSNITATECASKILLAIEYPDSDI